MANTNNEKCLKWREKATKGENGYSQIIQKENEWFYIGEGILEQISSLTVAVCKENCFKLFYEWDGKTQSDSDRKFFIVIKDDTKLMIRDEAEGLITFALSESDDAVKKVLILFSTDNVNTIIAASKDESQIDVRYHVKQTTTDIVQQCLRQILHPQTETPTSMESEVTQNAISDEKLRNEGGAE